MGRNTKPRSASTLITDHTFFSKIATGLATPGIEGDQASIEGSVQNSTVVSTAVLPVRYSTILMKPVRATESSLRIEPPNLITSLGIEGNHTAGRSSEIKHAIDHQRS